MPRPGVASDCGFGESNLTMTAHFLLVAGRERVRQPVLPDGRGRRGRLRRRGWLPAAGRLQPARVGLRGPPRQAQGQRRQDQHQRLRPALFLPPPGCHPPVGLDPGPEPRRHHHRLEPRQDQGAAQPRSPGPPGVTAPGPVLGRAAQLRLSSCYLSNGSRSCTIGGLGSLTRGYISADERICALSEGLCQRRGRYRSAARATPKPTRMPPDLRMRRRASFGHRSTPPTRPSTREYKVRDANPGPANVTPSSAGRTGEDPAGMNWGITLVNTRSVLWR